MSLDISLTAIRETRVFDDNFTHNVTPMWRKAGIYDALYMSEGLTAADVLPALRAGMIDMLIKPRDYRALENAPGWGTYEQVMPWLQKLVAAFEANPDGVIRVCK